MLKKKSINRRNFVASLTGLVAGGASTKIVDIADKYGKKTINALSSTPSIEDIVYGRLDPVALLSLDDATDAIVAGMPGVRRDIIYAIIAQERASGQSDFFMGEEFGIDQYKPAILFERHVFFRCLQKHGVKAGKKDLANTLLRENPEATDILSKSPTAKGKYGKSSNQYDRLRRAFNLGEKYPSLREVIEDSALMSCSWGVGQVLGENYEELGYKSVRDLVKTASKPETGGENFIRFAKDKGLDRRFGDMHLSDADIEKIAQLQNGTSVKQEYIDNLKKYMADSSNITSVHRDVTIPAAIGASAGLVTHAKTVRKGRRSFIAAGVSGAVGGIIGRKII